MNMQLDTTRDMGEFMSEDQGGMVEVLVRVSKELGVECSFANSHRALAGRLPITQSRSVASHRRWSR